MAQKVIVALEDDVDGAWPTTREAMASAGAGHLQLVVDPITVESIEMLGEMLAMLDRDVR
jgi:hypothetical protein